METTTKARTMLVVDPHHWLDENGFYPTEAPQLWKKLDRIGLFVSSGCDLQPRHGRPTVAKCKARSCGCSMFVARTQDDQLLAFCPICRKEEMLISNWRDTFWAEDRLSSEVVFQ